MNRETRREEESEVARCRRVRDELDNRFKTIDEALGFLSGLERKHKRRAARPKGRRTQTTGQEHSRTVRSA